MSDVLQGIDENVPFDDDAADALIASCRGAAASIDAQVASRASWVSTASRDFAGHFADLFATNASTARADGAELAGRLREVATGVGQLKASATAEQKRRETARTWKHDQDHRSWLDKGVDSVFGEDAPPVGPPDPPIGVPVSAPRSGTRVTPTPGSGGGAGGGTSSARPADLRSFASGSSAADAELAPKASRARADLAHFVATCRWGTLDASGVMTGFDRWLTANGEDVSWANVVATAFERAGGVGGVATVSNSALAASLQAAGVGESRADLTIPGPMAIGHPPTTGYAVDPVNTATGNFVETESDLGFAGACDALEVRRTYNSLHRGSGAFGPGWSSWTGTRVETDDEGARVHLCEGRVLAFTRFGSGWDRAEGEDYWLVQSGDGLRMSDNAGGVWEFDVTGRMRAWATGPGTEVRLEWDASRLVRLVHERGRWIELAWSGEGEEARVTGLRGSDGRTAGYGYDARGRLVTVTTGLGTRTYRWDDASDLLVGVVGADGTLEVENVYDEQGRVTRQRTAHGRLVRFGYLPGRVTVVSDADGTRSNTWIADRRGRLVGVVDADERRQSMSYDEHGNLVLVTGRDGAVTVSEHDERGRLVRQVSPSGGELEQTWDDRDRLLSVALAADDDQEPATTRFEYADDVVRHPCVVVDPEGGRTRLAWAAGLLREVVDQTGVSVGFEHDEHGDLVAVTDAEGRRARLERDGSGRVVAAVTPSGATTRYAYDEASGLLCTRTDPDGALWRFEHTAAGLLAASVDPMGGRTEAGHGPEGEVTSVVDPLGRATTRRYDDLGNLSSVGLPDGSTWRFTHDAMSRLREAVDPSGAVSSYAYDAVGDLTESVDGAGTTVRFRTSAEEGITRVDDGLVSLGVRLDRLGRMVGAEQPDGSTSLLRYDRCGRLVESVDATGVLTTLVRDAAGRVVELRRGADDTAVRYGYDACGRLSSITDERGGTTTRRYDDDGRVVAETQPTGEVATWEYDACGRVVRRRVPGVGTTLVEHDLCGRVVASRDPQYGRRTFHHDAAGQLVVAVDGNGGRTRYEYDANGRAVAMVDPLGARSTRAYDAGGNLVEQVDPLGRTTRAGYDPTGRQVWQEDPDGRRTEWTYDVSGRFSRLVVDGAVTSSVERHPRGRSVFVNEGGVRHQLVYDACGRLVRRSRDGRGLAWEYDARGRCSALVHPDGSRTTYERDATGALVATEHPMIGRLALVRDLSGRVTGAAAGGVLQRWERYDGWVVAHEAEDASGVRRTTITRDEDGRLLRLTAPGGTRCFSYDDAHQLIESRTGKGTTRWRYDGSGRLVEEAHDGRVRHLDYDAAGQLLRVRQGDRERRFTYDAAGRRTGERAADGTGRSLAWAPSGHLSGVTDHTADGSSRHVPIHVDALGELARVGDQELLWDRSGLLPDLVRIGETPVQASGPSTGPFTGVGGSWTPAGWRTTRSADDAWGSGEPAGSFGPVEMSAAGELVVEGLEWLGARVYDPATRGFLSTDPLDPVIGAPWGGNPYAYAGNDPLHAVDPWGRRPATDADLQAYADAHQGSIHAAGQWLTDNWEYVAGGAMVLGGGLLMFTPLGPTVGMGLISAGADTIIQKAATGHVNWGEVAVAGVMGGVGGAAGQWAARASTGGVRALQMATGVNAALGGTTNATINFVRGDHSVVGAFGSFTGGAVGGAIGGVAGPAGGTIARQLGRADSVLAPKIATAGLNYTAGFAGDMTGSMASGNGMDVRHSAVAGAVNVGTSHVTDKITGHLHPDAGGGGSLHDLSYQGTRTVHGLVHGTTGHATLSGWGVGSTLGLLGPS